MPCVNIDQPLGRHPIVSTELLVHEVAYLGHRMYGLRAFQVLT